MERTSGARNSCARRMFSVTACYSEILSDILITKPIGAVAPLSSSIFEAFDIPLTHHILGSSELSNLIHAAFIFDNPEYFQIYTSLLIKNDGYQHPNIYGGVPGLQDLPSKCTFSYTCTLLELTNMCRHSEKPRLRLQIATNRRDFTTCPVPCNSVGSKA